MSVPTSKPPFATLEAAAEAKESKEPWLSVIASRHFAGWMAEQKISLGFTTYQAGKLMFLGAHPDGRLAIFERDFSRCMGLWADPQDGRTLWLSTLYLLFRLEDMLVPGEQHEGYDRLYIPRQAFTTGDLDIHDIAIESSGRLIFINTLYSCIATISHDKSFVPLWKPPMISRLAAEDRCHMNGMALEDGKAAYVTLCSNSDVADGWRDQRRNGGSLIDVRNNQTLVTGLSMPHSPRIHQGKLYLHNSGTGQFGWVDRASGRFEPVCFCPGYLRGLAFSRNYAIAGLSKPRDHAFNGLSLNDELTMRAATPQCGLQIIDLTTGDVVHWLKFEGSVAELYDVVILPGAKKPKALGFKTDEIQRMISMDAPGQL